MIRESQRKIDALIAERDAVKKRVEEAKYMAAPSAAVRQGTQGYEDWTRATEEKAWAPALGTGRGWA